MVRLKLLQKIYKFIKNYLNMKQNLDERIAKTKAKKKELLMVLKYPDLPLHNNASELEARVQTRIRDVSLHTITDEGTEAKDTFLTIIRTARKLGVSSYEYILDSLVFLYSRYFEIDDVED